MSDAMDKIKNEINKLLKQNKDSFYPPSDKIPLSVPIYGPDEIMEVIDCLVTSNVTMGEKTSKFEKLFTSKLGVKHAIMVNSGSSANLLAAFAIVNTLYHRKLSIGDEIIFPALTWPTTIYPFVQAGLTPVLVDVEPDTFNINYKLLEEALSQKTKAICPVPILGNPCNMTEITKFADKHNLLLIEDTCEALGSKFDNKYCGTFGDIGTFSFYFSHHITTIEGGMVTTNDDDLYEIMLSLRSHGWTRHLPNPKKYEDKYPEIDKRFLFINTGFNLRPTELQASFGIYQLNKLENFNENRRKMAKKLLEKLKPFNEYLQLPVEKDNSYHTWFGFPFLVKTESKISRKEIVKVLESKGISTRPIVGGNLSLQPAFSTFNYKISGKLVVADNIHKTGIYIGVHPNTNEKNIKYISNVFSKIFMN